jgi:hypothetical protein
MRAKRRPLGEKRRRQSIAFAVAIPGEPALQSSDVWTIHYPRKS